MQNEDPREAVERFKQFVRDTATYLSVARLLAENEPIGELVMYSLMDDECTKSDLWARLKMLSDWLKETEVRYESQFPEDLPKSGNRYDLSRKPDGFKIRLAIFKEIVEKAESNKLWDTQLTLNDPVVVTKKFRGLVNGSEGQAP